MSANGGCLCGAVRYKIVGPRRNVVACHCSQCQRTNGHHGAYSQCRTEDLHFMEQRGLKWYNSSDSARRGFCGECGASLFFQPVGGTMTAVSAGSFEQPSGLELVGHIFCDDIPDYYSLNDDLKKYPGSSKGAFDNNLADRKEQG